MAIPTRSATSAWVNPNRARAAFAAVPTVMASSSFMVPAPLEQSPYHIVRAAPYLTRGTGYPKRRPPC
ncbi:hypothetical protein MFU01_62290 [Myxococcus fulvus]|uniref:Uncharacterized protein n=1 Tax=Myxococcus fulvus TaxID=33 RepID=A0A511TCM1_MYXFU|nr:hypothetical protein MFU01_62290 [Myxococcus fulvus]